MVRPTLCSISLTSKCQSTAVRLGGPLALAGSALWNRICPSFHPAFFHGIGSLDFSEFWHGARNLYEVPDRARFLEKLYLLQKFGKWAKNSPKIEFSEFKENFVINFHWFFFIMKIYIICCVSVQIVYLGKILLLRYSPKFFQPIRLQDL